MSIKIANDTANGSVTLEGQNVAGDRTITMPNIDCELAPRMQLMTAQNSTSGTSIDFTGIPSWAKKITVMFNGVSTSGTSVVQVQIGAGSIETTGYAGVAFLLGSTGIQWSGSGALVEPSTGATVIRHGQISLVLLGNNIWTIAVNLGRSDTAYMMLSAGSKTLSGTLGRIRITTVNGTDTFDAGRIGVLYEG